MRSSPAALRLACALLSSGLLVALLVIVGAPQVREVTADDAAPASSSTYLCYGYAGCRDRGYGNAGYARVNDRGYWNMYPGHNCTNYVAYRMIRAGMSSKRPFGYPGNATNWGEHLSKHVDGTPRVGAIAWWRAYDNGSGSAGHVAYVEKVTKDAIVISEDSWGGTFHWRRIDRGSYRWPTGFIHLVDKAIENTKQPVIQGKAALGETLTVTDGEWNVKPAVHRYKWYIGGERVGDNREPTYTIRPQDVGKDIYAKVIAKKPGWDKGRRTTPRTPDVAPGQFAVDVAPVVSGTTLKGETLTVDTGRYAPDPESVAVQWLADDKPVPGATERSIRLTRQQVAAEMKARITVTRPGYARKVVTSEPTDWVRKGYVKAQGNARLKGNPLLGGKLTAVPGDTRPSNRLVKPSYQWLRDGEPIEGATGRTYRTRRADWKHVVSVRITYSHWRRFADHETVATERRIRARTKMTTKVAQRGPNDRRLVVVVKVRTRHMDDVTVTGRATVKVEGRPRQVVRLEDGRAKFVFRRMRYGTHDVVVRQLPNRTFVRSVAKFPVKMRRP